MISLNEDEEHIPNDFFGGIYRNMLTLDHDEGHSDDELNGQSDEGDIIDEKQEEEIPGKSKKRSDSLWVNGAAFNYPLVLSAFIGHQVTDISSVVYHPKLIARRKNREEDEDNGDGVPPESIGFPDELYVLVLEYLIWKNDGTRKSNAKFPEYLSTAITQIRPKQAVSGMGRWIKELMNKRKLELKIIDVEGEKSEYIADEDGTIIVSNSMIRPLMVAIHETHGCMGKGALVDKFRAAFRIGRRYPEEALCRIARETMCETCLHPARLPKKQHKDSVYAFHSLERVQIDITEVASGTLGYLEGSHGYRYLLTAICCSTKKAWAWPLKTLEASETILILDRFFDEWQIPDILHSDNGRTFVNRVMKQMENKLKMVHVTGKPYTPQHQGQVERFNQTIKFRLCSWFRANAGIYIDMWPTQGLRTVLNDYSNSYHQTIRMAPDVLFFGRHRSPALRTEAKSRTKILQSEVPASVVRLSSSHTQRVIDLEESMFAMSIDRALHERSILQRQALSRQTQRQTMDSLRKSGGKLTDAVFPKVGQTVLINKPNPKEGVEYKAKDYTEALKITATVAGISWFGAMIKVVWEDDMHQRKVSWVHANELLALGPKIKYSQLTVPSWQRVQMHMKEFLMKVQTQWLNMRRVVVKMNSLPRVLPESVKKLTSQLYVSDTLSPNEYCQELVIALLDFMFQHWLLHQVFYPYPSRRTLFSPEQCDLLVQYVVQDLGFKSLPACAALWREDRMVHPRHTYPIVLERFTNADHDCRIACMSPNAQKSHVCCVALLIQKLTYLGQISPPSVEGPSVKPSTVVWTQNESEDNEEELAVSSFLSLSGPSSSSSSGPSSSSFGPPSSSSSSFGPSSLSSGTSSSSSSSSSSFGPSSSSSSSFGPSSSSSSSFGPSSSSSSSFGPSSSSSGASGPSCTSRCLPPRTIASTESGRLSDTLRGDQFRIPKKLSSGTLNVSPTRKRKTGLPETLFHAKKDSPAKKTDAKPKPDEGKVRPKKKITLTVEEQQDY